MSSLTPDELYYLTLMSGALMALAIMLFMTER